MALGLASNLTFSQRTKNTKQGLGVFSPGGGGEIRTHGPVSRTPDFKSGALDHSATPPCPILARFTPGGKDTILILVAKLLGIDYGSKRVGLAVTDDSGKVAFPRSTLPNDRSLMSDVVKMIQVEHVTEVVIGEPMNKDGGGFSITKNIRKFADDLGREVDVTIYFEPEYYSSQEARTHTGEFLVDAEAAAIILNSFLTKRHGNND